MLVCFLFLLRFLSRLFCEFGLELVTARVPEASLHLLAFFLLFGQALAAVVVPMYFVVYNINCLTAMCLVISVHFELKLKRKLNDRLFLLHMPQLGT